MRFWTDCRIMAGDVYSEVEHLKREIQDLRSEIKKLNERIDDLVDENELDEPEEEDDESPPL